MTSLSSAEASYQTLSTHSGGADDGTGLGVTLTSRQTFLSPKRCLSQAAGVCVCFSLHALLAHGPAGVGKKACVFPYSLCCCLSVVKS